MPTLGPPASKQLQTAAIVLWVLGAAAVLLAVAEAFSIQWHRAVVGVGTTIMLLLYTAVMVFIGRGLWQGRRWSRGPAAAFGLVQLPVAWSFLTGMATPLSFAIGIGLAVASVVVLVCVLHPSTTRIMIPQAELDEAAEARAEALRRREEDRQRREEQRSKRRK
ncbi:hypothetical protein [Enemella sp. A6]|uniref:hypothetical protein n=1 Tax=Enemella sp. A6 TaxID=3440152 RepID=UPI003EBFA3E3